MTLRIGNRGFTLVEVMIAAAVLALGATLIYEAFFTLLDTFNYYSDYLEVVSLADEKIWEAQDSLTCLGEAAHFDTAGDWEIDSRRFKWKLLPASLDGGLYEIDLYVWQQIGKRKLNISRTAYALYMER